MRPLIITALYPPAVGGAATYFGSVVPELARRLGYRDEIERLTVLTERMPGQPRQWTEGKLRVLRYLPNRISLQQRRWALHAATYVWTQLWFATRLPGLVQHERIDLIHFHTRYRGRLFYASLRRSGVPVLADLRDKMTTPAHLADTADRLLCCGEGVQRFATEGGFPADRAVLIPNAFDPPDIPSPAQVSETCRQYGLTEPYLLFVGDITYNKGVYDLVEAYEHWKVEHPQVQLVYAGTNREGTRFLSRIERAPGVTYLGHIPRRDVLSLIRSAEILLLPSRSEGLPTVILEAVALGTKVVCPPGIPEFERHLPQFVLPTVSEGAILEKLNAVWHLNQAPSYPLFEHSRDRVVEELAEVYAACLDARR